MRMFSTTIRDDYFYDIYDDELSFAGSFGEEPKAGEIVEEIARELEFEREVKNFHGSREELESLFIGHYGEDYIA